MMRRMGMRTSALGQQPAPGQPLPAAPGLPAAPLPAAPEPGPPLVAGPAVNRAMLIAGFALIAPAISYLLLRSDIHNVAGQIEELRGHVLEGSLGQQDVGYGDEEEAA